MYILASWEMEQKEHLNVPTIIVNKAPPPNNKFVEILFLLDI